MSTLSITKPIGIGSDHAGFDLKQAINFWLADEDFALTDYGTLIKESVDYPDYAHKLAKGIEDKEINFGILICGSANGVAITANKHPGIRAGIAWNVEVAKLIRQHNDCNIICIPARFVTVDVAIEMVTAFIQTPFEGGRHAQRVDKINC